MVNNLNFFVAYDLTHVREQVTTVFEEADGEAVYNLTPDFEYQINIDSSDTSTGFRDYVQFYLDVDDNSDSITADDTTNISIKSVSIKFKALLFTHPTGYLRYLNTGKISATNEFIANTLQKDKTDSSISWSLVETGFEHVGRKIVGALEMTNNESDSFIQKGTNTTIFTDFKDQNYLLQDDRGIKYSASVNNNKYNAAKDFIIQLQNHILNINLEDTNEPHDLTPEEVKGDILEDDGAVPIDLDMTERNIKSISLYIYLTTSLKVGGVQQADDQGKTSLIRIVLNKDDIGHKDAFDTTVDDF